MYKLKNKQLIHLTKGKHHDGGGLYLRITKQGKGLWTYRFRNNKKSHEMSLGTFTDSLGNYGEVITLGTSKSDKEKVILDFLLQGINQKGDKFIGRQSRNSLEQEVGVGSFFYISGTGDYKKLIGKKCYYAVKYLNKNAFYKHKCD